MPTWLTLIVIGVVVAVIYIIWIQYKSFSYRKMAENSVYVAKRRKSGAKVFEICPATEHFVTVKKDDGTKGEVLLKPEWTGTMVYPPTTRSRSGLAGFLHPCAVIRCVDVAEGSGTPWTPFAKEKQISDTALRAIAAQAGVREILEEGDKQMALEGAGGGGLPWSKPTVYIALAIIVIIMAVGGVLSYLSYMQANAIATGFGLQ